MQGVLAADSELEPAYEIYEPSYEMWDTLEIFCIKRCITGPPRFNISTPQVIRSTYTKINHGKSPADQ